MAEYQSFHYLMHKQPEQVKAVYVTGPTPLTFPELYSPREDSRYRMVFKGEKSYWRTRDRIEYILYEDRKTKTMLITCTNLDSKDIYRTICVNLESLYFEVESKVSGSREPLVKKKDKKLADDTVLYKAVADFLLARLSIGADPLPWPTFDSKGHIISTAPQAIDVTVADAVAIDATNSTAISVETATTTTTAATASASVTTPVHMEKMCTLTKLSGDAYEVLEIKPPDSIDDVVLPNLKLSPPVAVVTPPPLSSTTAIAADAAAAEVVAPPVGGTASSTTSAAGIKSTALPEPSAGKSANKSAGTAASAPLGGKTTTKAGSAGANAEAAATNDKPAVSKPKPAAGTSSSAAAKNPKKVIPI